MDYTPLPPEWITRIAHQYPEESQAFIQAVDAPPRTSIRWHPIRAKQLNRDVLPHWLDHTERVPWSENGVFLRERPLFTLDPLFHAGAYYVQEASSMFLAKILDFLHLPEHPTVLDACAAPGGKSTVVLDFLNHRGFLVANEVIPNRAKIAAVQLSRWGYTNFMVTRSPMERFQLDAPLFDLVIADAPCSGEGMFRKLPHARGEWSVESAAQCATRQASILEHLWPSIAPGGYLIYSTCTFNPDENERQLDQLLKKSDAEWINLRGIAPEEASVQGGGLSFLPHRASGEGFFVGVVRKRGMGDMRVDGFRGSEPSKTLLFRGETWLIRGESEAIISQIPGLQLVQNGRCMETVKGTTSIPHQHAAWQLEKEIKQPRIELTLSEAQQYLKGLSINRTADRGWVLVTYANLPLGWVKSTGNRLNNHYLKSERIAIDLV